MTRRRLAADRTLAGPRWAFWLYDATVWLERAARALGIAIARRWLRVEEEPARSTVAGALPGHEEVVPRR